MFLSEIEKYLFFCEIIDFFRVATKKRQIEKSNENIYRNSEIYINILGSTRTQQKWSSNDLSSHLESELDELKINKSCLPCSRRRLEQWDQWAYLHYETRERESTSDNSKQKNLEVFMRVYLVFYLLEILWKKRIFPLLKTLCSIFCISHAAPLSKRWKRVYIEQNLEFDFLGG